jgi:hypothetical protein
MLITDRSVPLSEEERTTLLLRNLILSEAQRWRTLPEKPRKPNPRWLRRVLSVILAVLHVL